ncbi:hypothetical protein NFI96_031802, partial [Prochilodus magdalenae]
MHEVSCYYGSTQHHYDDTEWYKTLISPQNFLFMIPDLHNKKNKCSNSNSQFEERGQGQGEPQAPDRLDPPVKNSNADRPVEPFCCGNDGHQGDLQDPCPSPPRGTAGKPVSGEESSSYVPHGGSKQQHNSHSKYHRAESERGGRETTTDHPATEESARSTTDHPATEESARSTTDHPATEEAARSTTDHPAVDEIEISLKGVDKVKKEWIYYSSPEKAIIYLKLPKSIESVKRVLQKPTDAP